MKAVVNDAHLFGSRIINRANEMTDIVAHGLGGDTSGSGLEIYVAATANAILQRVVTR
jgi:hypothetical protein